LQPGPPWKESNEWRRPAGGGKLLLAGGCAGLYNACTDSEPHTGGATLKFAGK
jgi:hypothetical protein